MGLRSFFKSLFGSDPAQEEALKAARTRHGIKIDPAVAAEADKATTEEQRFAENYDAWDELKNWNMNFFFGSWITRKFRPIGEEKVKRDLEKLEKKRQKEAQNKRESQ